MLINLDCGLFQLTRRQDIELVDGRGISITCISGSIWITQHRDNADIVLGPGDSFVLDRPGLAIVHALAASTVRISPVEAARPRRPQTARRSNIKLQRRQARIEPALMA